jgi:hypothetical protein
MTAVTPVRMSSPPTIVLCPTVTPATSVIASNFPAGRTPIFNPKSEARGRSFVPVFWPREAKAVNSSTATIKTLKARQRAGVKT